MNAAIDPTLSQVQRLPRRFRLPTGTTLPDVDPTMTPEQVLAALVPNYPYVANATLGEPTEEGGALVYPIRKPTVQTKGAPSTREKKRVADTIARLSNWAGAPQEVSRTSAWKAVFDRCHRIAGEAPSPVKSAYLPLV
ncbi:PRTRC system protein C (plasmid) [Dyella sp. BiH032]|uniref:PRTRC system protein C n=1 Tax=Dyella sp. BiH032 TaxID=3075430 RepID=UPI002892C651|nr:PRTRC system protein C [Dyella sp. BiH032]WNL48497.1 PRTRC system protein C [Dyella sp. BiH032]